MIDLFESFEVAQEERAVIQEFDAGRLGLIQRIGIAEMVEKGICTEDGHLLKFYKGGEWCRAGKAA